MSYVEQNLMPGEEIALKAKLHWAAFLGPSFNLLVILISGIITMTLDLQEMVRWLCIATVGFFLFLALVGLGQVTATFTTTEFAVTNKRVIAKTGWLRRRTIELLLPKVESLGVQQPLLGRLLNYGTIVVTGTGGTTEPFAIIADPMSLRKKVNTMIAQATA